MIGIALRLTPARAWSSLAGSKPLRFAAVMALHFMQGVPLGLWLIAIPAWPAAARARARARASATAVGIFVSLITIRLPVDIPLGRQKRGAAQTPSLLES